MGQTRSRSAAATQQRHLEPSSGDLADLMARTARGLRGARSSVEATLEAITAAAVDAVPGAEDGGVSLVTGSGFQTRAATSDRPATLGALQVRLDQGPCLHAIRDVEVVHVPDMAREQRWPRFAAEAAGLGVGSMLCFRLYVSGRDLGALNLLAGPAHAFSEEATAVGRVFSAHAAIALAAAEREVNLERALRSRDVIGQAKGILMERYKLTADQAFTLLAQTSSMTNRKVNELAEDIATTGDVPG